LLNGIDAMTIPSRFSAKTALVTGGASGIGLAIVRRLLAEGAKVVACDVQADQLKALEAELGSSFLGVTGDVTKEADMAALVSRAVTKFGGLHCAFNVAGASRPGYIVDLAETDWDFTVDLCLKGVFLAMKHQARHMIGQGRGAIVNVASLNAHVPMHAGAAYASAKAGVEMLTKNGALEFAPFGVRVAFPWGVRPSLRKWLVQSCFWPATTRAMSRDPACSSMAPGVSAAIPTCARSATRRSGLGIHDGIMPSPTSASAVAV
jgi:NADP-dependent 3-hydroxy acid dehydrogenase YdfG